jgi:hypothetical protein
MKYQTRGDTGWGQDLYVIWLPEAGIVKIGRSCNCERRFRQIKNHMPFLHVELTAIFPGSGWIESACHRAFDARRCGKEWFRVDREEAVQTVNGILAAL